MPTFRFGQSAMFEIESHMRIEGVERTLEYLEDFLLHAKEQAFLRKRRELSSCKEDDRELLEAELEIMEDEWRGRFPAYFYGSLVVLLWGEVEALIEHFADDVRTVKAISLALGDVAGPSPYSRLRKYVQAVLGVDIPESSQLEDLYFLRNLYAHHGGDTTNQSASRMKRINAIVRTNDGVYIAEPFLVVNGQYISSASSVTLVLSKRLRALHPSPESSLVEIER